MFLDIGIGILLTIFTSEVFSLQLTGWWLTLGILFALFPDIDFIIEFLKHKSVGGKVIREHREISHFPLSYIPLICIIGIIWGKAPATLFSLGILFHFIHDSVGIGWGIKWLWPFKKTSYKFFCEKDGTLSKKFIVSWEEKELIQTVEQHGDPNWIKNIYFRPHPISIIEFIGFLLSLFILYLYLN